MAGYVDNHNDSVQKEDWEEHYTKPLSTVHQMLACSAHPGVNKWSLHIQDCVRIMDNCSKLLKWEEYTVARLNNYMWQDGYSEEYRHGVLKAKLAADRSGEPPINLLPGDQQEARWKAKKVRKRNWVTSGCYVAPSLSCARPNLSLPGARRAANHKKDPKLRLCVLWR